MTSTKPKTVAEFEAAYVRAFKCNTAGTHLALVNATRALKKITARAEAEDDPDYSWQHFIQHRGPAYEFTGRAVASFRGNEKAKDKARWQEGDIWRTKGGVYVAILVDECLEWDEPKWTIQAFDPSDFGDEDALHHAIMNFYGWSDGARSMARHLQWNTIVTVT